MFSKFSCTHGINATSTDQWPNFHPFRQLHSTLASNYSAV
jgi:hypothetical protein